jgi:fluoroacetyl-CoA thioesterase
MKNSLKPGLTFEFQYKVPEEKTVPRLFPEFPEGQVMPNVFASGFMIGLFEFACIKAIKPHLDWPDEQSVGIGFQLSHTAATPPGFTVTVRVSLTSVEGKKLTFAVEAEDGIDRISEGSHERFVINAAKFNGSVAEKQKKHLS